MTYSQVLAACRAGETIEAQKNPRGPEPRGLLNYLRMPRRGPVVPGAPARETPDVAARLASLEAEVRSLKDLLAEVRQSRDEWKDQAGRLVLALPAPDQAKPGPPRRPWWQRLTG